MVSAAAEALSAPTIALHLLAPHVDALLGSQSAAHLPVAALVGPQSRFHSHESICVGSQAAPSAALPFLSEQKPKSLPVASKSIHSHTLAAPTAAHGFEAAYGSQSVRQTDAV